MEVAIPLKRDGNKVDVYKGWRVQHSTTRGPAKGGIRYHKNTNLDDIRAMAMLMTWKTALLGLPLGGAKGGVAVDTKTLTTSELENLTRRYAAEMLPIMGTGVDVPAPDVGTNEQVMAWIMDTLSVGAGHATPGAVTGKPMPLGGSSGRHNATGHGLVAVLLEALPDHNMQLEGLKCAIQGYGNVGAAVGAELQKLGAKIVALADESGCLADENGLDLTKIDETIAQGELLVNSPTGEIVKKGHANKDWAATQCDVLIPAALGGVLDETTALAVKAKIVIEGANGPTTTQGDKILHDSGKTVIPDFLANGGGVCVSFFEMVQSASSWAWTEKQVYKRLEKTMQDAYRQTWEKTAQTKSAMRQAAMQLAVKTVAEAHIMRGIYP